MLNLDEINVYLRLFHQLSLIDLKDIFSISRIVKLNSGCCYIDYGSNSKKLGFITKGLIRGYTIKDSGAEVTVILRWENQFIASYDSIIRGQPSKFTYQALEDTVLLEFDYEKAEGLLDKNPKLAAFRNRISFEIIASALDRAESLLLLTHEERYIKLILTNRDIVNRVPDKYIATFLGITPVSLSRIKKRVGSSVK